MEVLAFVNSGGGQAKSSTCHSIASSLALDGKRVLAVDMDGQCSLTNWCGISEVEEQSDLLSVLLSEKAISTAIRETPVPGMDILPSSMHLYQAEKHFADEICADELLKIALNNIDYDFVCIDTPPQMGILSYMAMIASQNLVIPVESSWKSLQAMRGLLRVIEIMKQRRLPDLSITAIVPSRVDMRQTSCKQAVELLRENFGELVSNTVITDSVVMKDAFAHQKSVIQYAPNSKTATQINELTAELIGRLNEGENRAAA
jgi:chromosome partitioning protein